MKITRKFIKNYFKEAIIGSTLWTVFLTPYTIFILNLDTTHYLFWLLMQFTLVLPISAIVYKITKFLMKGKE